MLFEQQNQGPCKTYLVARHRRALLVDPVLERVSEYLRALREHALDLKYVVDTHTHADHISGAAAVRDRTGAAHVMHRNAAWSTVDVRVDEGDVLELGGMMIRVMFTPGHSRDSITLVLPDRLLTGDFLFLGQGGAGRTDGPGGDATEHWESLQKLSPLADDMLVFPAHDYRDETCATLGEERRRNPRLVVRDRGTYVAMLASIGPAEQLEDVMNVSYASSENPRAAWVPIDAPGYPVASTSANVNAQRVREIGAGEVAALLLLGGDDAPLVIDVREPDELEGELGHIEGAVDIPVGELPRRLDELEAYRDRAVVAVCRGGGRSATAAAILSSAGFERVYALRGGMLHWSASAPAHAVSGAW